MGNTTYTPSFGWPAPAGQSAHPVGFVDWCDAYAYCAWAGKRLCGKIGGGATDYLQFANAGESQWMHACSAGGTRTFPYGDVYDGEACNGSDYPSATPTIEAGSESACEGGYPGLFDLSGNVREWEDACTGTLGATDPCRIRGGAFDDEEESAACDEDYYAGRQIRAGSIGFRCCYDLE